jgi:cytochrome c oxidase subunit 2
MRKFLFLVLTGAIMFSLTACSSGSANTSGNSGSTGTQVLDIEATNFEFNGGEEFTVQSGQEVQINFSSAQGTHGLAIDAFNVNIEESGTATFTPTEPGEYEIYCSVFCGEGHDTMNTTLTVK